MPGTKFTLGPAEGRTRVPGHDGGENGVVSPPGQRIALASDAAFSFVYPHLLAAWRRAGAEIFAFSPLAGDGSP